MGNLLKFQLRQFFFYNSFLSSILLTNIVALITLALMHDKLDKTVLYSLQLLFPIMAVSNKINHLFYEDYKSGNLEFLLTTHEPINIILSKLICLFIVIIISIVFNNGCSIIFFELDYEIVLKMTLSSLPVVLLVSAILGVIGVIKIYFDRNSTILSALILPFIIPVLILYGLYIKSSNDLYFHLSCGIAMIVAPVAIYLTKILLSDLYNN